jgi:two-component system, OmpR family, response regulator BaeR
MILVVEDEVKISTTLVNYLRAAGYEAEAYNDGLKALQRIESRPPQALLLDVNIPSMDGMQLCQEVRKFSELPIIMITARIEEIDRLRGLELGADDYVCKPFSPREVVARVKAVLRRNQPVRSAGEAQWRINPLRYEVLWNAKSLRLTRIEYSIIATLLSQPGRIFSRTVLMDQVSKDTLDVNDRAIDSHIKNIRKKLTSISGKTEVIETVYGLGYRILPTNHH